MDTRKLRRVTAAAIAMALGFTAPIAAEVPEADRERCVAVVDRRARAQGLRGWTVDDVVAPANLRLHRAVVSRLFVLHPERDVRREVALDL